MTTAVPQLHPLSHTSSLLGRLVANVVPGTIHQGRRVENCIYSLPLLFLSSAGRNLLPGELTLPRTQAVSLAPVGASGEADVCMWSDGFLGVETAQDSVGDHWDGLGEVELERLGGR